MSLNAIIEDAFQQALVQCLIGQATVHSLNEGVESIDDPGVMNFNEHGFASSLFALRLQFLADRGHFDKILESAIEKVTPEMLASRLTGSLADVIIKGLEPTSGGYNRPSKPGWSEAQLRPIAQEAMTAAVVADSALSETLRERIGISVDRDQVEISVGLKPRE